MRDDGQLISCIVQLHHPFPAIVLYQHLLCPSVVLLVLRTFVQTRKLMVNHLPGSSYTLNAIFSRYRNTKKVPP